MTLNYTEQSRVISADTDTTVCRVCDCTDNTWLWGRISSNTYRCPNSATLVCHRTWNDFTTHIDFGKYQQLLFFLLPFFSFFYQVKFICSRIKKRRKPRVKNVTLKLCGVWKNRYNWYEQHPTYTAYANHRGVNTREGGKSVAARLDLMKRGRGINGRDDKSSGIEIRMAETLAKINPTDPLILA
jgi:hypothetical protein